jgi:hypothetical protein
VLLAPYYRFVDDAAGAGVVVVLGCALLAIAAAYALGKAAGGGMGGVAAAAIVALSPLHVRWSRAVMSDVPASAALAWLGVWVVAALRRRAGGAEWLVLGAAFGLAMNLRVCVGVLFAPVAALLFWPAPAAAATFASSPGAAATSRASAVAFVAGSGLGALSLALVNLPLYGAPFRSGYDYWAPGSYFGAHYLFGAAFGPSSAGHGNLPLYVSILLGFGTLYPWPVAALAALGAIVAWRRGGDVQAGSPRVVVVLSLGVVGGILALHAPYFWQWDRLLLPVVPFVAALAGGAFAPSASSAVHRAAALLALAAIALVAYGGDFRPPDPVAFDVIALRALERTAGDRALIVADTNPFFFARYLRRRGDRRWLPLIGDEHQRVIARLARTPLSGRAASPPPWMQPPIASKADLERALASVGAALVEGREVYFSRQWDVEVPFMKDLAQRLAESYALEALPRIDPDPDAPEIDRVLPGAQR